MAQLAVETVRTWLLDEEAAIADHIEALNIPPTHEFQIAVASIEVSDAGDSGSHGEWVTVSEWSGLHLDDLGVDDPDPPDSQEDVRAAVEACLDEYPDPEGLLPTSTAAESWMSTVRKRFIEASAGSGSADLAAQFADDFVVELTADSWRVTSSLWLGRVVPFDADHDPYRLRPLSPTELATGMNVSPPTEVRFLGDRVIPSVGRSERAAGPRRVSHPDLAGHQISPSSTDAGGDRSLGTVLLDDPPRCVHTTPSALGLPAEARISAALKLT